MKFQPIGEYILVEVLEGPTQTESGLIIPEVARKKAGDSIHARILAMGKGKPLKDGTREEMPDVRPGDEVYLMKYAGAKMPSDSVVDDLIEVGGDHVYNVKVDERKCLICRAEDVLCQVA